MVVGVDGDVYGFYEGVKVEVDGVWEFVMGIS